MKILCATGGSGGHIFPALQTAAELRARGHAVALAGVLAKARGTIEAAGFDCHHIEARGMTDRSVGGLVRLGVSTAKALAAASALVRRIRPDKIVGFGGYGSFPVLMAGIAAGIPTMLHEQNVVCGKANRVLSGMVRRVAVSFQESAGSFDRRKVVWTGCPCHNHPAGLTREDLCRRFGLDPAATIIVLLGGSQGSRVLNETFFEAMRTLRADHVQAVHVTGAAEFDAYKEKYRQAGIPVVLSPFYSPVEELYTMADLVVARSGAATVSELAAFGVPSVLVPYPFAGNHQKNNAEVLSRTGAAVLLEQQGLTAASLSAAIASCKAAVPDRAHVRQRVAGLFVPDAARRLADAVEEM